MTSMFFMNFVKVYFISEVIIRSVIEMIFYTSSTWCKTSRHSLHCQGPEGQRGKKNIECLSFVVFSQHVSKLAIFLVKWCQAGMRLERYRPLVISAGSELERERQWLLFYDGYRCLSMVRYTAPLSHIVASYSISIWTVHWFCMSTFKAAS